MINQRKKKHVFFSFLSLIFLYSLAEDGHDENRSLPKVAISAMDYSRGAQTIECEDGCNSLEIRRLNSLGIYPICVRLYNQEPEPVVLSGQSFHFSSFDHDKIAEHFYGNHQLTPFLALESVGFGCALHWLFPDMNKYIATPQGEEPALTIPWQLLKYSNLLFGAFSGLVYWSYVMEKNSTILSFLENISEFQSSGKKMILPPGEIVRFFLFLTREEYMSPLVLYANDAITKQDVQLCYIHLHVNEKTLMYQKIDQLDAPQDVKQEMWEILDRLDRIPVESPESHIARTHLEWLLGLPWGKMTEDNFDLVRAQEILNADHAGLQEVKDTILEFIAVRKLNHESVPPIICLVGPPGIGKTSLAGSIARSLNREFARISLGGMHDEAEIRGHRRTYIGAMPGRVIQAMKTAGSSNPVLLLDEVDKMGNAQSQAAVSALLEVLDPMQNKNFRDTYLNVPFDLSRVLFIATANSIHDIPAPLLDRMEVIQLPGYTMAEKVLIARNYLVGRSLRRAGLDVCDISIDDDVVEAIISGYTREAGVRGLGRLLDTLCAKAARIFVEQGVCATIQPGTLETYLGPQPIRADEIGKKDQVGMVNGLAWTAFGGVMTRIEVALTPGDGKLKLTGKLGDVMKESAQAALTYVRAHAQDLGIDGQAFKQHDIHIHAPDGATPKDGPSAGITMLTALVSAFTNRKFDARYAMTGEIDLHGNVLPIGGVKEKLLAAKRYGIAHVIMPHDNQSDLKGKEELYGDLDVIWVDHAEQVLKLVFNVGLDKEIECP